MKKFFALLLAALMIFSLVACNGDSTDTDNEGNLKNPSTIDFYVNHNGVKIELGADAQPVIAVLGEPASKSEAGNCGGQGTLTKYVYASFELYVLTSTGGEVIDQITLLDDASTTAEGISIGATKDEVIAACGKSYAKNSDTGITYTSGNKNLIFKLRDGAVVGIDYRMSTGG
jgi:hypothetical protein